MSVSTIDGTLTEIVKGRSSSKFTVFKSLTFRLDDGSTEELKRQVTCPEVAEHLVPGASGRFYAYKALDLKGIHGVRLDNGTSVYAYHMGNMKIFPIMGAVSLAWIILMIFIRDAVPMLGVLTLILAIVGFFVTRRAIEESKAQFDADSGAPPRSIARAVGAETPIA